MNDISSKIETDPKHVEMTASIVAAYLSNHQVATDEVPRLIRDVHASLSGLNVAEVKEATPERPQKPAVPVKKSIHDDYIICLECGQKCKTLKRHLQAQHAMSMDEYRAKWGLPADYPMTAPNYSKLRSESAKRNGLGRSRAATAAAAAR